MKDIRMQKLSDKDLDEIIEIWYESSIKAHDFIPDEYWNENKSQMKEKYIPMSETYIAKNNNTLLGFVSMMDEYLAAIFIRTNMQGLGIGSELINHVKEIRKRIQLKVYKKNVKSIEFYKKKDFRIISESIDNDTGEQEYIMEWKKENSRY